MITKQQENVHSNGSSTRVPSRGVQNSIHELRRPLLGGAQKRKILIILSQSVLGAPKVDEAEAWVLPRPSDRPISDISRLHEHVARIYGLVQPAVRVHAKEKRRALVPTENIGQRSKGTNRDYTYLSSSVSLSTSIATPQSSIRMMGLRNGASPPSSLLGASSGT